MLFVFFTTNFFVIKTGHIIVIDFCFNMGNTPSTPYLGLFCFAQLVSGINIADC